MNVFRYAIIASLLLSIALIGGEPAKPSAPKENTVYITKTGEKYHLAGCRHLSKSMIPISLTDAKKKYTACSVCKPPNE